MNKEPRGLYKDYREGDLDRREFLNKLALLVGGTAEDVPRIKASMLIHYASDDERINVGIPAFEAALREASVDYKMFMYDNTAHAFFNDTNPSRYNKAAAQLAWERTIAFFKEKLTAS